MKSKHTTTRITAGSLLPMARRRGVTLLEAMIAATILLVAVAAISSAFTAGQHHAYESQLRISGAMAAEDLMGRLNAVPYHEIASNWNGFVEQPGQMQTPQGDQYPSAFSRIGRRVTTEPATFDVNGLNVSIHGLLLRVETFDNNNNTLLALTRFVPEPPHATISGVDSEAELAEAMLLRTAIGTVGTGLNSVEDLIDNSLDALGIGGGGGGLGGLTGGLLGN